MLEPPGKLVGIGVLLVVLLGAQLGTTVYFIDRERSYHTEQFTEQTRHRLQTAVDRVDEDLDKLLNISELLARLVTTDDLSQHERELRAAIRHQRGLLSATLWDTEGEQRAFVLSESLSNPSRETHVDLLERAHQRLIERDTRIATAGPATDSSDRRLRAFVQSAGGKNSPFTHIGVVIDVQTALSQLSSLATRSETDILVYGPEGYVESASTLEIPSTWRNAPENAPDFYAQMREYRHGSERLTPEVTAQLGLPEHERSVHFMSFESSDDVTWSIGMITSLLPLRTEQSWVLWRAGLVSAAFGLLLFGLGGLLMFSIRRRSELEERLERKQLISELDAKADAILDAIPVGVVVVDEAGCIRDVNKEMTAWLGPDSLDKPLADVWHRATDRDFELVRELLEQEGDDEKPQRRLLEDVEFGDERVDLQVESVFLPGEESGSSTVLAFEDVTSLKEMEEQLLRTEKLATVGVLSAGIAHEIGTPLNVIRGRTEYALSSLDDPEAVETHLEVVFDQVDYVNRIVRQLLDFSRDEEAEIQPTDLETIVESTLQLIEFQAEDSNVELEIEMPDALPEVAANPDELRQVLINLLLNAFDACDGRGTISLEARTVDETPIEGSEAVDITVRDTGDGIEAENVHKVFDPFYTTKKRGKGTGLGLAIVDRIVRTHEGHIDVCSVPGEWTRFEIHWPIHSGPPPDAMAMLRDGESDTDLATRGEPRP